MLEMPYSPVSRGGGAVRSPWTQAFRGIRGPP